MNDPEERLTMDRSPLGTRFKALDGALVKRLRGRPLPDTPKTWRKIGYIAKPPSYYYSACDIFIARDGTLRWNQWCDGNFYRFHGKLELLPEPTV